MEGWIFVSTYKSIVWIEDFQMRPYRGDEIFFVKIGGGVVYRGVDLK